MKDLTSGNIYKNFIVFAIPMVLAGILSQGYSIINTIVAGKLIGENGLAAIGAVSPLDTFINSIFWGYGNGIGIYCANLFGAGEFKKLKSVIVSNMAVVSTIVLLLGIVMTIFKAPVYNFLNIDPAIIGDADKYFVVSILGKAIVIFSVNCVFVVNAMGVSSFPLCMSAVSSVLNIAISIFSVSVLGAGVEGLAYATVIASLVVAVLYIIKFKSYFERMSVSGIPLRISVSALRDTAKLSFLTTIQQSVMYFSTMILSPFVNSMGGAASASYTITNRIYEINASLYQNSSKTVGNYTAQCYGAQKYDNIKKGMGVGMIQTLIFSLPALLVCILLPQKVCSLFFDQNASVEAIEYSVIFLRFYLPLIFINIAANLFHNFFRGIRKLKSLVTATLCGSVARIVASMLLVDSIGIHGIYIGWVLSWFADAVVGVWIYFRGKWLKELKER